MQTMQIKLTKAALAETYIWCEIVYIMCNIDIMYHMYGSHKLVGSWGLRHFRLMCIICVCKYMYVWCIYSIRVPKYGWGLLASDPPYYMVIGGVDTFGVLIVKLRGSMVKHCSILPKVLHVNFVSMCIIVCIFTLICINAIKRGWRPGPMNLKSICIYPPPCLRHQWSDCEEF